MSNNLSQAKKLIKKCLEIEDPYLDLGNCGITSLDHLPELFECTHLETLILSNMWVDGEKRAWVVSRNTGAENKLQVIKPSIAKLINLQTLIIGGDYIENWEITDISCLASLSNLSTLYLRSNQITDINPLAQIKGLRSLYLSSNRIADISSLEQHRGLSTLFLSSNQITDITALVKISGLNTLNLHTNQITDISCLASLSALCTLDIRGNQITDITALAKIRSLSTLYLSSNKLTNITALARISGLSTLDLSFNNIKHIPTALFRTKMKVSVKQNASGLCLYGNPIESPPMEVLDAGQEAIEDYLRKLESGDKDHLYEAKLLVVGEPGSGKTTFCRKIKDLNTPMPKEGETTKGIVISPFSFQMQDGQIMQLNTWDFGGQEIYHQTHQFFLTHRSLYILLTDNRRENTDFNWWLDTIQAFGGDSPVLIVQNEKEGRKQDIDKQEISERYKQVKKFNSVNFLTKEGVTDLKNAVEEYAAKLEHLGEELPKSWVDIRKDLKIKAENKDYISIDDYIELCAKYDITDRAESLRLARIYHNLGVLLNFDSNPVLKHTVILKNEWATDAVYKILDDKGVIDRKGRFTKTDCAEIWSDTKYKEKQDELLELMLKFDLCYRVQDSDNYIMPQMLPADKPTYNWDDSDNLTLTYSYEGYMPKGLTNRLMARLNWYVDIDRSWKKGVVMERQGATAEIREPFGEKQITVKISGSSKRDLLLFIDEELYRMHRSYSKLIVKRFIGCICDVCKNANDKKQMYEFEKLEKRIQNGKKTIECEESYAEINVYEMLSGVFTSPPLTFAGLAKEIRHSKKRKKLFISFSKADKIRKERLEKYLQQLERDGLITTWSDKELEPGEVWDDRIKGELESSDIVLFLCSQDMLATDYIQNIEMKRAFEKEKKGEIIVVPIILKPCTWSDDKNLPRFTALPTKAIPVIDLVWRDEDYAFQDIYEGLKKILTKTIIFK